MEPVVTKHQWLRNAEGVEWAVMHTGFLHRLLRFPQIFLRCFSVVATPPQTHIRGISNTKKIRLFYDFSAHRLRPCLAPDASGAITILHFAKISFDTNAFVGSRGGIAQVATTRHNIETNFWIR